MKKTTYADLKHQLDEIMDWFDQPDAIDIDEAVEKYKKASALIEQLEVYLSEAQVELHKDSTKRKAKKSAL